MSSTACENIYLLNDHKTGLRLTNLIRQAINKNTNKTIQTRSFYHFWNDYNPANKYIILIRNPKETIISGYLYHKKCIEKWAKTKNGYYYDYWKDSYFTQKALEENEENLKLAESFSNPIPYQDKLNSLPQTEGIIMEMNSVAYLTITGMYNLVHYGKKNVYILKYEDLVFNHDKTINDLCKFIGINQVATDNICKKLIKHNLVYLKNNNTISSHSH